MWGIACVRSLRNVCETCRWLRVLCSRWGSIISIQECHPDDRGRESNKPIVDFIEIHNTRPKFTLPQPSLS
jgi:hypothetical protein